jgi:transcription elongation factor GreA
VAIPRTKQMTSKTSTCGFLRKKATSCCTPLMLSWTASGSPDRVGVAAYDAGSALDLLRGGVASHPQTPTGAVGRLPRAAIRFYEQMTPPEFEGEPISAEGLATLKRDLNELETEGRRAIAKRILVARELGDLSENAEYHAAKEDQAHLETNIKRLKQRLRDAVVTEMSTEGNSFDFGRTAEVLDEGTGETHTWTLVGPTEADLSQGKLSAQSPVAKALTGHSPGETVEVPTPRGTRRLRIERLL